MTEWNAAEYARLSALQAAMAEEVLGLLREHLRGDERVLDVGCGNGKVTRKIAALVPRGSVVGVDASAKMIELARKERDPEMKKIIVQYLSMMDSKDATDYMMELIK